LFGLSSEVRPEAAEVLALLHNEGLRLEMLTGDSVAAAGYAAENLHLDKYTARCTPEDKLKYLQNLQTQGHVVMAVGDGINDAPFLGAADVAVSMPLGAAMAQSQADAILTGENLRGILTMHAVSQRVRTLTRQNIAWALGYNLTVLPLAIAGILSPWLAALGMSVSSLLVVANALRVIPVWREKYSTSHKTRFKQA
jgi:Cu2+-exporting ATPase